jgi:hypothetical protein
MSKQRTRISTVIGTYVPEKSGERGARNSNVIGTFVPENKTSVIIRKRASSRFEEEKTSVPHDGLRTELVFRASGYEHRRIHETPMAGFEETPHLTNPAQANRHTTEKTKQEVERAVAESKIKTISLSSSSLVDEIAKGDLVPFGSQISHPSPNADFWPIVKK